MKIAFLAACLLVGSVGCATSFTAASQKFAVKQAARQHNCPSWKVRVVKARPAQGALEPQWVMDVCGKKYRYELRAKGSELAATSTAGDKVSRR